MPAGSFPELIFDFIESRGVELVHVMNSRLAYLLLPDLGHLSRPPAVVVQLHAEESERAGYVRYVTTRYGNLVDAFSVTSRHLAETVVDGPYRTLARELQDGQGVKLQASPKAGEQKGPQGGRS